jgi:hypothetical protein
MIPFGRIVEPHGRKRLDPVSQSAAVTADRRRARRSTGDKKHSHSKCARIGEHIPFERHNLFILRRFGSRRAAYIRRRARGVDAGLVRWDSVTKQATICAALPVRSLINSFQLAQCTRSFRSLAFAWSWQSQHGLSAPFCFPVPFQNRRKHGRGADLRRFPCIQPRDSTRGTASCALQPR